MNRFSARAILNTLFVFLLVAVIAFFLLGEMFMLRENPTGAGECTTWNTGWQRICEEGTIEIVELGT